MIIKTIKLTNFRNHKSYSLNCKPTTTLILGENGCGKTSVLEAIYILTQGKSFRATDPDIIKRDTEYYLIELEYDTGEKVLASYDKKSKTFKVEDKKTRRLSPKYKYPIILFLPSDLNLITGAPSRHRDYFDRFFSILSPEYNSALNKYNKALVQRNKLLKDEFISQASIFPWNVLLAKNGVILNSLRQKFIKEINQTLTETYRSIAENGDNVEIKYITDINNFTENEYLNFLEKNYEKDRILGHTSFGVHRDDFEFIFNQTKADGSASRGETRSIILALKFIEAKIIAEELGKKPIILLDDVFSELDNKRRKCLINNFKNHQVIITSVEKFTNSRNSR
ncbi:DNA replication and repair protein RecF [Candidatus Saccharibacteria bacterium]|nr:DNA replication and repair protein RecF [Candidatus Saccharibacteria bacterium]